VVMGWASGRGGPTLRIITVYVPGPPRWSNPRTRGESR
jgi:hypothetical protein